MRTTLFNPAISKVAILIVALAFVVTCAPKATSTSGPAPVAPPNQSLASPTVATPKPVSSEDEAWFKIMEAAKKEGKVTAYSFTWSGDIGLAVKKAFENRYGIGLDIITGRGSEYTERLKTERRLGQRMGDMTEGSSGQIASMKIDGLLVSVVSDLPVLRQKDVWWVSPTYLDPVDKANLVWRQALDTPWVNTNLVKPGEDPTSWKDLLLPKWKGKMSLREPRLNASLFADFVALLDKKAWDENYIKSLHKQELTYSVSTLDEIRSLAKGEFHLAILGSGASGPQILAMGAPVRAITMQEGELALVHSIAAIAGAPHPNATKVFLNWLLTPEGQSVAGEAQSNLMLRRDVPDFQPQGARTKMVNPIVITQEQLDEGTNRFRDKWYDKLVGR